MKVIGVTSPTAGAGKTTAIVAIGQLLRRSGVAVGYRRLPGPGDQADAAFVASALRLAGPSSPLVGVEQFPTAVESKLDVLFVELGDGSPLDHSVVNWLNQCSARLLVVARYQADSLDELIRQHCSGWPAAATIVLVTAVPEKGMRSVQNRVFPAARDRGCSVLGAIPQDRALLGLTVGELAESLGAEVLCATDQLDLPVEAVMISAMSDEGAEHYFRRIARKAVVAGGDRPDIHMPALATDPSCIVLTDGFDPDPTVFKTADEQGVPLLKVSPSTVLTLDRISDALIQARFRQTHKVSRAVSLFGSSIDRENLATLLGIDRREQART